jgi:hypothetical protein
MLPLPCGRADISKVQDDEVGDGTTSVVVFAGEILREAEQLINQKVHPMTIIAGVLPPVSVKNLMWHLMDASAVVPL